jgi:hypothetical protein
LNISPETVMKIATYDYQPEQNKKKVLLDVLKGKVRSTVKQKYDGQANSYQIKTKAAVAGVRGTDFIASYDPKMARLEVVTFEGKVEVGQLGSNGLMKDSVFVPAGQMTEVLVGKSPEVPKAVPAAELKQMDQNSQAAMPSPRASDQAREAPPRQVEGEAEKPPLVSGDASLEPIGPLDPNAPPPPIDAAMPPPPTDGTMPALEPSRDTASLPPPPIMYDRSIDCVTCTSQPPIVTILPPPPIVPYLPPPPPADTVNISPDFMNQVPKGPANVTVDITYGP